MTGIETCCCGHVADEHRHGRCGYHECEVVGCDCICFEEDEEADHRERLALADDLDDMECNCGYVGWDDCGWCPMCGEELPCEYDEEADHGNT